MCSPAWAISASSPAVLSATVLPPVFGPVMSSTRDGGASSDVHRHRRRGAAFGGVVEPVDHRLDEQRMAGLAQLDVAGGGQHRLHRVHHVGEPGPRLQQVELLGHRHADPEVAGPRWRKRSVSASRMRKISSASSSSSATMSLLISTRGHRLEEQARAGGRGAVHDAGNRRLVLGPHHQHEAAVAAGDDLFLQVLRGVAAACAN